MEWTQSAMEMLFTLGVAAVVFRIFRKRITPIKRLITWLVAFIIISGAVDIANRYIHEAHILPDEVAHLPLQVLATSIIVLYVPIRSEGSSQEEEKSGKPAGEETKSSSAAGPKVGKKSYPTPKRRFRKK